MSDLVSNAVTGAAEPRYMEEPTLVWSIQRGEMHKPCFHTELAHSCTCSCELGAACRRPIAEWLRNR